MYTNVNLAAPIGVLAFLGTGLLFLVAALALVGSLVARKFRFAKFVLIAMLVIAGIYLGAMLAFSLAGREKVLARGEEKHFCEIDCHLAYSITNVRQIRTLGTAPNLSTAQGVYTIVTIKTRFDETTIAPWRGNGLLYPNNRVLTLVDEFGSMHTPSDAAQRALEAMQTSGTPLTAPLRPGESYTTEIAFDLPGNVKTATLLINEGDFVTHFIIGHENGFLHGKTRFQLGALSL
ncbi:MAG TPA: hypothetical protein VLQ90_07760 [Pyrinomonadaceae bacterium]|nr:hypothetical protein [Pyrinomonadaceae bacterium]